MKLAIIVVAVLSNALLTQTLDPLSYQSEVVKRNAAPDEEDEILLTRVARATEFNAYVESNITDCVRPDSVIRAFCSMDYMVPKVLHARFLMRLNLIRGSFSELERNFSANCASSLRNTICKGSLPRCSDDHTTATFSDYSSECSSSLSCAVSSSMLDLNANFRTSFCRKSGMTYSLTRCQSAGVSSFNSAICGNLPNDIKFPEWMVPLIPLQSHDINMFKQHLMNARATNSCIEEWMKVSCNSIPYCTADSSKIVSVASSQSCQTALNCLPTLTRAQLLARGICNGYPESNSQRVTVSTQVGYSYSEAKGNHGWRATHNILLICGLSLLSWLLH